MSDPILWTDYYVCPNRPITELRFDVVRKNYISPDDKQLGFSVTRGTTVQLKAGRRRIVGQDIVTKPVGQPRQVLKVFDYRYFTQFDQQAFQTNPRLNVPCQPYRFPSTATTVFVATAEGKAPLSDLERP